MEEIITPKTHAARLQAFLFHYGEPVSEEKVARALNLKKEELSAAIDALRTEFEGNPNSGLAFIMHAGDLQLATKPEFADIRAHIVEEEWKTELTPAAQETLSLVAYLGPVSKVIIDYLRGVNSGFTLRNLMLRGLVERNPSKEHPHSYDYHVSFEFLRHMGLSKVEDLPEYEKYHRALDDFAVMGEEASATPVPGESNA